jgi:hypothetical protein
MKDSVIAKAQSKAIANSTKVDVTIIFPWIARALLSL